MDDAIPQNFTQPRPGEDREIVQSVLRALDVLRSFDRQTPRQTLSQVAERTGLSRATARRFLLTFTHAGYMEQDGGRFRPTAKLLELGHSAVASLGLWDLARPVMADLSARLGEAAFAAVLDGQDALYVAHAPSPGRVVAVGIAVGRRLPAYCTSVGRVLLAGLPDAALAQAMAALKPTAFTANTVTSKAKLREIVEQTRRDGYAIVDEELEVGLRSVSVPLRAPGGAVLAALNVCGPSSRVTAEALHSRFLPEILQAADRINRSLRD
ncbi:IclR family transcriptional regulator domain-containing protein [Falsiroseomonas tokyonensis]|uniref:IclR family transcriptional regulator C-terminal domain-containing protein n=1 Tax=Falsiroseomonas tokyonensis TaxID=430521 RepID=A0ABV7BSB7_9PROT|nr:IclR family transcriptional regulator C-terminal domain-containing protein [Falsiroseomonas tokyonensis]MBU8538537.1 helix-turn-helix domain-containing protein [Falsiroseomonas tokyonensis]